MSDSNAARVLVVDDEPDLRKLLTFNLEAAGFAVEAVANGTDGLAATRARKPNVVVLDIMLPDLIGTEVCRALRADPNAGEIAVLMLSARGDEGDRLLGFEVGADDYVVKPFSVREVVMRVKLLARRAQERTVARSIADDGERVRWRDLEIDRKRQRLIGDGVDIDLTPLEFKLFSIFIDNPGRLFSRADLLHEVWGMPPTNTRTVDVHVRRVRIRLGKYGDIIETIHGLGYRLRDPGK